MLPNKFMETIFFIIFFHNYLHDLLCLVYNKDSVNLIIILGESDITTTNYVNNCNGNKCLCYDISQCCQ